MTDTGGYLFHKVLHDARIADRQRELAAERLARRNRKQRWDSMRLATARGLHKLANAIAPAHALRVPAQRKPA
jgi:hypothetical protein